MKQYYKPTRKLHLYFGLFISPFLLIFGFSVLFLNHTWIADKLTPVEKFPEERSKLNQFPRDTSDLATARNVMSLLNIQGEVGLVFKRNESMFIDVYKPGTKTNIKVDLKTDSVLINKKKEGSLRAMNYLHMMPGPHNLHLRGNSFFMKIWKVLADAVVYLILFLTSSGIFLWVFHKKERKNGLIALIGGALIFIIILLLFYGI
jgi:hypothetical protein